MKTLWATTSVNKHKIKIYTNSRINKEAWAWTIFEGGQVSIEMHPSLLTMPAKLDRILVHEFIHVAEYLYPAQLAKPDPENCSRYAMLLERTLPQLLANLLQVSVKAGKVSRLRRKNSPA